MGEILIRSSNIEALQKVADLVRFFGLEVIVTQQGETITDNTNHQKFDELPIIFAEKPDVLALADIWKNKKINLDQIEEYQNDLRQKAWGNRL